MTLSLLYVEDDENNRDMLAMRLSCENMDVRLAADGETGIKMAIDETPDLILMDISLPDMDGFEAARHLRQSPKTKDIPIIALTAHALASDRKQAEQAGFDDFDTKPIDFDRLIFKIKELTRTNI